MSPRHLMRLFTWNLRSESQIKLVITRLFAADIVTFTDHLLYSVYQSTSKQPHHGELSRLHLWYRTGQGKRCARCPISLGNPLITLLAGQLLVLLQNRRLQTWRPLFAQTRKTILLSDHPPTKPLPKSRLRPEEQDECLSITEPFRCVLRGFLV